jgi:hypothetical protein
MWSKKSSSYQNQRRHCCWECRQTANAAFKDQHFLNFIFIFINIYWLQSRVGYLFALFSFDSEQLCEVKAVDVTAKIVAAKCHVLAFSLKDTTWNVMNIFIAARSSFLVTRVS